MLHVMLLTNKKNSKQKQKKMQISIKNAYALAYVRFFLYLCTIF